MSKWSKKIAMAMALGMCMMAVTAGCGKEEETGSTGTKAVKVEQKKETEKTYQTVGNKAEGAYDILLKNSTGQDITSLQVKTSDKTEYPVNMIKTGEVIKNSDTVELFYMPEQAAAGTATTTDTAAATAGTTDAATTTAAATDTTAGTTDTAATDGTGEKAINITYNVQITLADGKIFELSSMGFDDMKERGEVTLCYEEEVGYIKYTSKTSGDEVSTKEQELGVKAQKAAQEAAAAAAAAATQETPAAESQVETYSEQPAEQTQTYEEPAYEEPTYEEPVSEEPVYEEPAQEAPAQDSESCLGDGVLLN